MSILFERLHQLGKEAKDLADATGLDPATLYNYRDGKVELGIYKAIKISEAMRQFNEQAGAPCAEDELDVYELFRDVLEHCAETLREGYLTRGWHVAKLKGESDHGEREEPLPVR